MAVIVLCSQNYRSAKRKNTFDFFRLNSQPNSCIQRFLIKPDLLSYKAKSPVCICVVLIEKQFSYRSFKIVPERRIGVALHL